MNFVIHEQHDGEKTYLVLSKVCAFGTVKVNGKPAVWVDYGTVEVTELIFDSTSKRDDFIQAICDEIESRGEA